MRECTCVLCVCLRAHWQVSVGREAGVCVHKGVCGCVCMGMCVHAQQQVGFSCLLLGASELYFCFFYEDPGPQRSCFFVFTSLVILLSGLGGHVEDLPFVYMKVFIRSLSGLVLQTSFHGLPASQALKVSLRAGGVWLWKLGGQFRSLLAPPRGTCRSIMLLDPPCAHRVLTVLTVHFTDEEPELQSGRDWFWVTAMLEPTCVLSLRALFCQIDFTPPSPVTSCLLCKIQS